MFLVGDQTRSQKTTVCVNSIIFLLLLSNTCFSCRLQTAAIFQSVATMFFAYHWCTNDTDDKIMGCMISNSYRARVAGRERPRRGRSANIEPTSETIMSVTCSPLYSAETDLLTDNKSRRNIFRPTNCNTHSVSIITHIFSIARQRTRKADYTTRVIQPVESGDASD